MPRSKRPRKAWSVIHGSDANACPALETYAVASAIPVTTWMMNANRVALPNTYIHPVRGGTGCFMMGPSTSEASVRASNHAQACRRNRISLRNWRRGRQDLNLTVPHAHGVLRQWPWRRPGRYSAVLVIHAAVAGTHEQLGVVQPSNGASQMGAVHRERSELARRFASQPGGRLGRHAGPCDRRRVLELHLDGPPVLEFGGRANAPPLSRNRFEKRRQQKARDRDADQRRRDTAESDAQARQHLSPAQQIFARGGHRTRSPIQPINAAAA